MKKKNKSNYEIAFLKRKNMCNNKSKVSCYDIVVCKKSMHNKKFVVEKLGSLDNKNLFINNFRLIYWLQFNIGFNIKASQVFLKYFCILKLFKND